LGSSHRPSQNNRASTAPPHRPTPIRRSQPCVGILSTSFWVIPLTHRRRYRTAHLRFVGDPVRRRTTVLAYDDAYRQVSAPKLGTTNGRSDRGVLLRCRPRSVRRDA